MNAIGGFSAPLNGVRRGHSAKMSSRQKQETPRTGLSGTHYMTDVENQFWQAVECRSVAANRTARFLVSAGFIPRLETLYRYAGSFGSPHHIGCAVAAGERNNKSGFQVNIFSFLIGPAARPWVSQSAWQTYRLISGLVAAHSIAK
jgi:hypothetical protein